MLATDNKLTALFALRDVARFKVNHEVRFSIAGVQS